MPNSRFLVQSNQFEFDELVKNSSLPRFITNQSPDFNTLTSDRINIPISDQEGSVDFYLISLHKNFQI